MKKCALGTLLVVLFLMATATVWGQSMFYQETFDTNVGWTLDSHWSILNGYLRLYYSPTVTNYDLSAVSPVITVPANAGDLVVTMFFDDYSVQGDPPETMEIAVLVGGTPTVLWTYDQNADWGVTGGTDLTLSLAPFGGQDVQLRFRSYGASTYNFNYWYIYEIKAYASLSHDLAAVSLTGSATASVNALSNYTLTVRNGGQTAVTPADYSVQLMKEGDVQIVSLPGVALSSGETADFTLPWTPAVAEQTYIYGKVTYGADIYPGNNQTPNFNVNVFPQGSNMVMIGTGTTAQRYPLGSLYGYERSGSIYTSADLVNPGLITGIQWDCAVQYGNTVPYRILMKNTTATAFIQEPWATTITDAQVCAEGSMTFDQTGWVFFSFTTPFFYTGDNLMVLVETNYGGTGTTSSQTFRYTDATTASHHYMYAENSPPTTNGYLSDNRPNVGILFSTVGMGSLSGLVTSGGNPLEGANIVVETTPLHQLTNTAGTYNFPYVQPGTYNVTCSKLGYMNMTQQITIVADQASTLNFVMLPAPNVDITGLVVGSDAPTVGLADATVNLTGVINYTGTTDATGHFTIPGVLAGNTYNYVISKASYQSGTGSITVGATNYDMGTIVLTELVTPPLQVTATPNADHTEVLINWRAPGATGPGFFFDFEIDNGGWVPSSNWTDPLGDWEWTNTYDVTLYDPTGSTSTQQPPSAAYSGTGLWGTVIYGPYTNLPVSGQRSFLRQTFDLTGFVDPVLNLWHHMDGFNTWDYGQILVNGTAVWGTSAAAVFMPWQVINVDLSAYENQTSVEVSFEWSATTVVNYAGWYIDDVYIGPASSIPTGRSVASNHPLITPVENDRDRALIGYKVWRLLDGQESNEASWTLLTATTVTDTFYVHTNWQAIPDGLYKFAVKSVYTNDVLSTPAFSNTVLKHAVVNVTGTVVGSDAPTVGLAGAEVSLTGMADYSATTNAQGQFTIPGVYNLETYNYTITKLGYTTASGTINVGATDFDMGTITLNEIALPAAAVMAEEADPNVNITWMAPGTGGGEWIQWDDGTNFNSIGLTSGGTFDVASRWTVTDLTDYVGQSLFAIQFWPGDTATYSMRVWTGGSASGPAQMVYDEPYTGYTVDVMNTYLLTTPVPIQAGQELWFG
ncbi:MAG: carboxypeptidase-like regulatory domain-containing protein, partial [Candidatus Cloacimonadaceae bacterium]